MSSESVGQSRLLRRSRMDTSMDIIRAIGAGAQRPTHIMYKANLSWGSLQDYIANLEKRGLVASSVTTSNNKEYGLTQKGFELLERINSIRDDLIVISDV
ncbi:MAG TPA: winged helix-turn-helix domain-containing protein [Nitrososphaerales archaeon]|nr:winged helix-turn-helix domain-containing protein [Nitrososphaerales archaeon]